MANIEENTDGTLYHREEANLDTDGNQETTDEERELPGIVRPEKGDGWTGRGTERQTPR